MQLNSFFTYVINSGLLANGGSYTKELTTDSLTSFQLQEIRTTGNTGVVIGIKLSNGKSFSNQDFSSDLIGKGQNGVPLLSNMVIWPPNLTLEITITNNSGATLTEAEEIQFIGYKLQNAGS